MISYFRKKSKKILKKRRIAYIRHDFIVHVYHILSDTIDFLNYICYNQKNILTGEQQIEA